MALEEFSLVEMSDSNVPRLLVETSATLDANGRTICEDEMVVCIPSLSGKTLTLALNHEEYDLEPIFSGAAWAGSVLWAAAQVLTEVVLLNDTVPVHDKSVLELGCGLGIPGFCAALLGAREVVLTEQPTLMPLLVRNINRNFPLDCECAQPKAAPLSWGTDETEIFAAGRRQSSPFDLILICDCVFEPLYGNSWKLLCETLRVLCPPGSSNQTTVLIACERRCDDGIDDFLSNLSVDFDLEVQWNSYADGELKHLLESSHIGTAKKPLRIYRAKRCSLGSSGSLQTPIPLCGTLYADTRTHTQEKDVKSNSDDSESNSSENEFDISAPIVEARSDVEIIEEEFVHPLVRAAMDDNVAAIVQLLHAFAFSDEDNKNICEALWLASNKGYTGVVDALLDGGADANATCSITIEGILVHNSSPLMAAASAGHEAVVRQLLAWGADSRAVDSEGRTASELASLSCAKLIDANACTKGLASASS